MWPMEHVCFFNWRKAHNWVDTLVAFAQNTICALGETGCRRVFPNTQSECLTYRCSALPLEKQYSRSSARVAGIIIQRVLPPSVTVHSMLSAPEFAGMTASVRQLIDNKDVPSRMSLGRVLHAIYRHFAEATDKYVLVIEERRRTASLIDQGEERRGRYAAPASSGNGKSIRRKGIAPNGQQQSLTSESAVICEYRLEPVETSERGDGTHLPCADDNGADALYHSNPREPCVTRRWCCSNFEDYCTYALPPHHKASRMLSFMREVVMTDLFHDVLSASAAAAATTTVSADDSTAPRKNMAMALQMPPSAHRCFMTLMTQYYGRGTDAWLVRSRKDLAAWADMRAQDPMRQIMINTWRGTLALANCSVPELEDDALASDTKKASSPSSGIRASRTGRRQGQQSMSALLRRAYDDARAEFKAACDMRTDAVAPSRDTPAREAVDDIVDVTTEVTGSLTWYSSETPSRKRKRLCAPGGCATEAVGIDASADIQSRVDGAHPCAPNDIDQQHRSTVASIIAHGDVPTRIMDSARHQDVHQQNSGTAGTFNGTNNQHATEQEPSKRRRRWNANTGSVCANKDGKQDDHHVPVHAVAAPCQDLSENDQSVMVPREQQTKGDNNDDAYDVARTPPSMTTTVSKTLGSFIAAQQNLLASHIRLLEELAKRVPEAALDEILDSGDSCLMHLRAEPTLPVPRMQQATSPSQTHARNNQ